MLLGSNKKNQTSDETVQNDSLWTLKWSDEFNGSNGSAVDNSKWSFDTGNCIVDSNGNKIAQGWGNDEKESYTDSINNVYQQDGHLVIKAINEPTKDQFGDTYNYSSGKIKTLGKFSMKYGRVDIRAKLPLGTDRF
jgi:beta-glucanase (GH16 family)